MPHQLSSKEQVLEQICALGCRQVNQILANETLQTQQQQLQQLDSQDRQWVLQELQAVMNVYSLSGSCSID